MYVWSEKDGTKVFRDPSGGANGNTYDKDGNLVTCEHIGRRVSRTKADGTVETVVDGYDGKRLNSPNDVVRTANGDLCFTDPTYGLRQPDGSIVGQEYPFPGVFRYSDATKQLKLLADDFEAPNGLVITDDQSTMYICDTRQHIVRAFDVAADGSLRNGKQFVDVSRGDTVGRPDGMKLDSRGNLYVTANTAEGIWVYAPDGTLLGLIGVGESPANCAWGGDDWQTLFVTAQTSVYRLHMKVAGQPVLIP
jgi:gluconolactonase